MTSMSTQKASSSSTPSWKYDVFLNFRGDTRNNFTDHLYKALKDKFIVTFRDEEKLKKGKSISTELFKAIEESRFAIVILSRNYASSTWCLKELVKIIECMNVMKTTVLPIFYDVDPSDVRKQTGLFGQSFAELKERFKDNKEKVQTWKATLEEVANLKGWHLQDRPETKVIQDIVDDILDKLGNMFSVEIKGLVGINPRVEKLISHLDIGSSNVRVIGIWGPGGIGKTTLAKVVYGKVSNQFEACGFITNVREVSENIHGLLQLQKTLLNQLLNEGDVNIHDVDINGVPMIKNRLRHKKILLVLDDVNDLKQLEKLAGEHGWFGPGSRVIITTRDKHLLETHEVNEIYEVEALTNDDSLQLFSLKAFKKDHPPEDYVQLSQAFVYYSKGLPLALEVLGSFLFNKSIGEWTSRLDKLKKFPDRKILDVLKISYDGLQEAEREIFLNIACFFNHQPQERVKKILDYLGLCPEIGLRDLIDKSLLKLNWDHLQMHDLLQEMGRDIVRQECPKEELGKRSRLWLYEDIDNVLTKNTGTKAVQGIVLKLPKPKNAKWNPEAFSKMKYLKVLEIHNVNLLCGPKILPNSLLLLNWSCYPSKSLPVSFQPDGLVELRMCSSKIERLWQGRKSLEKLKVIQLGNSIQLIETPDFTEIPNLEELVLENCLNLPGVHPSIGVHKKLKVVNLNGCKNLKSLPSKFEMESLEILILSGCSKVKKFPEFGGNMKRVCKLYLDGTSITKLPASIENLTGLVSLKLKDCKNLVCLPSTISNLKLLKYVDISGCSEVERLLENFENAESVEELDVSGTALRHVPSSIGHFKNLRKLSFEGCKVLSLPNKSCPISPDPVELSPLLGLCSLTELNLRDFNLKAISNDIGSLFSLKRLDLSENNLKCLPESIGQLTKLEKLVLFQNDLVSLPESIGQLTKLDQLELGRNDLVRLPENIGRLTKLAQLDLGENDFVSLPESICQLSKLRTMYVTYCRCLKSLPKLPLNIETIYAEGCKSLEVIPDLLRPNAVAKLNLDNCFKLSENQVVIDYFIASIKEFLLENYRKLPKNQRFRLLYPEDDPDHIVIVFPGSEIPEWFSDRSMGPEVNIELHSSRLCNDFMGIAFCAVTSSKNTLSWSFIVNGKEIYNSDWRMDSIASDHILLATCSTGDLGDRFSKSLEENDANGLCQIKIRFDITDDYYDSNKVVKKCGVRLLYKEDIENHIPTDSDSDSRLVTEGNKVKRRRDEYDGAGPSGEGSSNDVPHPKRIERPTKLGNSDSEESSEYKDCDEELSDVQ